MPDLLAARSQMAVSLAFHIIFAVVGIGMPVLMVIAERRWQKTGDPVHLDLAYPERLSRLLIFVKWLFVIPSVIVYWIVSWIAGIVLFLAFFAILFTGRYPRSLFDFTTGAMRWSNRIGAYLLLLTDAYPPFRMGP